ncbi:hypothetical protein [Methylotenera sp. 1P/1]|uniref:hypothetical protein n=1 Tax=Methylotenera sp. 1P/1 TaxID=1131551 RepID=UPI0003824AEA|nr:hypothetical protein [Methylotenera sp. 1P/1]
MADTPKQIPIEALKKVVLNAPEHEQTKIVDYVEWQSNKGRKKNKVKVVHLERLTSEVVFGKKHDVWDVHTNEVDGRWWVITEPTNLYSQTEFVSLDYTLSFHIGVTARVAARDAKIAPEDSRDRLISVWRRWEDAAEAIEHAIESADFQSIGMKCRETLLQVIKAIDVSLIDVQDRPKVADFVGWSLLIADKFAGGERNQYIRSYLKSSSEKVWQLVNWVTHTRNATLYEAELSLEATEAYISALAKVIIHHESEPPLVCPKCSSYRIDSIYEPDQNLDPPYVNLCAACGWNNYSERLVEDND